MEHEKEIFLAAATALQKGQTREALALLDPFVASGQAGPAVNHLVGLAFYMQGQADQALPFFLKAVAADGNPLFLGNLGSAYRALERVGDAEEAYRAALARDPRLEKVALGLIALLLTQGRPDEALVVASAYPSSAQALYFAARIEEEKGRAQAAEQAYRKSLEIAPAFAEAHNDLGGLLRATGRLDEALAQFEAALDLKPDFVAALLNQASLYAQMRQWDKAKAAFRAVLLREPFKQEALRPLLSLCLAEEDYANALPLARELARLCPADSAVWNDLGFSLHDDPCAAEEAFRRALSLDPDQPVIMGNLAVLLKRLGRFDESEALFRKALALLPDAADIRHNYALLLLRLGRMAEAYPLFEARYDPHLTGRAVPKKPLLAAPQWQGEDVRGMIVLVQDEQAFGDEINFVRFSALLKDRGAELWLMTRPPLKRLMQCVPWIDRVLTPDQALEAGRCAFWVFSLSLPGLFGTTSGSIPVPPVTFTPDPQADQKAKDWLTEKGRSGAPKVGLVWSGKPKPAGRSVPFDLVLDVMRAFPDIDFVSLQVEPEARAELSKAEGRISCLDAGATISDFADTAALMRGLDLVLSIDSAPAHLAGALGVPVWILLMHDADWRWFLDRADSPWYPSMRLFRQRAAGEWGQPLQDIRRELGLWLDRQKG